MTQVTKKKICKCVNCGNEAEMMFTCSLSEGTEEKKFPAESKAASPTQTKKAKGKATCSHCGNEAEMWLDL